MELLSKTCLIILSLSILVIEYNLVYCEDQTEAKVSYAEDHHDLHVEVDSSKLEYAKGSVCGYCTYCKFCKLCDKDCPCETSKKKPNCKMCKYCKYCNLCSAVCDTICKPGGILDRVSGAIVNSLPSFNKEEVDADIHSVHHWIQKKKDEL